MIIRDVCAVHDAPLWQTMVLQGLEAVIVRKLAVGGSKSTAIPAS